MGTYSNQYGLTDTLTFIKLANHWLSLESFEILELGPKKFKTGSWHSGKIRTEITPPKQDRSNIGEKEPAVSLSSSLLQLGSSMPFVKGMTPLKKRL